MSELGFCCYNLPTKQQVCYGVKIKAKGDSKFNDIPALISNQQNAGLKSPTVDDICATAPLQ